MSRNLSLSPARWCSQCRENRPKDRGGWLNIGLFRQRWLCVSCLARALKANVKVA